MTVPTAAPHLEFDDVRAVEIVGDEARRVLSTFRGIIDPLLIDGTVSYQGQRCAVQGFGYMTEVVGRSWLGRRRTVSRMESVTILVPCS